MGGVDDEGGEKAREREFIDGILRSPSLGWKLKTMVLPSSAGWRGRGRVRKGKGRGGHGQQGSLEGFDDDARVLGEGDLDLGLFGEEDGEGRESGGGGGGGKGEAEGEGVGKDGAEREGLARNRHLKLPSRVVAQEGDFGRSVFGSLSAEWWRPMFSRFDLIPSFFFFGCLLSLSLAFFRSSVPGVLPLAFTFRVLIRDSQTVFFSRDKI